MREIQGLVRCAKCRWYHADFHVSCVNCGELLRAQVDADTGDLSEGEMGQTRDVARLTRERDEARVQVDRLREALERVKAERNRLRYEAALFRVLLLLALFAGVLPRLLTF